MTINDTPTLIDVALDALTHGFAVVPPAEDGSKRPDGRWQEFQQRLPTEDEVRAWYRSDRHGIGVVCGAVSGGLEMLEFEGRAVDFDVHDEFASRADEAGLGDLIDRIYHGYVEWTPTGGLHLLYRVDGPVAGNTKLARRPATPDELAVNPDDKVKVLIETRGEGGYVIVAPSHGPIHPEAREWRLIEGGWDTVVTITAEERDELHNLAKSLDTYVASTPAIGSAVAAETFYHRPTSVEGERPGDVYNNQPDAAALTLQLLERHGWQQVFHRAHDGHTDVHLRRPGKAIGTSAVLHLDAGTLYVFSSSTTFEQEEPYTPFAVYAHLEHAGDYSNAARSLRPASAPTPTQDLTLAPRPAGSIEPPLVATTGPTIDPRPFTVVEVASHLAAGITEPAYVPGPHRWLYAGRLTAIQSEPGVGKTWLALWLALHAIEAGTDVVYLDEEGGPELIAERLHALGADIDAITRHLIYVPFPARQWDLADQQAFHDLLQTHPNTSLAVFDSLPDFLAMAGKSEDSAQDVTWWINRVCGICRDHGVAQIVLDHLPKPEADSKKRTRSRYSRGSGAKLAKVDATYLIETGREFDAHHSGQLKLWKTKDRRGRLAAPSLTSNPILLNVNVDAGHLTIDVRDPEPDKATKERHFRPTGLMEKLSESLTKLNEKGIKPSGNQLIMSAKGGTEPKREALRCLIDEGYVAFEAGPGNRTLHLLVKPYRQITDPRSDSYMTMSEDQ